MPTPCPTAAAPFPLPDAADPAPERLRRRAIRYGALLIALTALFVVVWLAPPHHGLEGIANYAWLHTVLESSAIVVAGLVFGVAWNAYSPERPGNIIVLAFGLLVVGIVDFLHMLSYAGMPAFVTPSGPEKAINFWLAGRFVFVLTLLGVASKRWAPFARPRLRHLGLAASLGVAGLIAWIGLFHADVLPRTFVAGVGLTPVKVGSEYVIVGLLLLCAVLFARQLRLPHASASWSLLAATIVSVLAELCFTLYSDVTDVFNLLGHAYRAAAYGLIYRAVFVGSVREPFERMARAEQEMRQQHALLARITETSPAGISVWSHDGTLVFTNAEAERILGRSKEEPARLPYNAAAWQSTDLAGNPLSEAELPFRKVIETGQAVHGVQMAIGAGPGSGRVCLSVNAAPLLDAAGQIDGVIATLDDITASQEAEYRLRRSEARLKLAMKAANMGGWVWDLERAEMALSEELTALLAMPPGPAVWQRTDFHNAIHAEDRERVAAELERAVAVEQSYWVDFRMLGADGAIRWFSALGTAVQDPGGKARKIVGIAMDISQRKQAELLLGRVNRVLRSLTAVNEQLIHAENEAALLDTVCRIIVEVGGYRMAWVAQPQDDAEQSVLPIARHGDSAGLLDTERISWADNERGRGPTGTAIRTGTTQISQNYGSDPHIAPWRAAALQTGYQSSITFPLKNKTRVYAALSIYAAEPDAFTPDEVRFLQELADDLSFGIETLRIRAERDRMLSEQARHDAILRQSLIDSIQSIAAMVEMRDPYTAGHQRRVAKLAVAIARSMGMAEDRIQGLRLAALIHDVGKIQVPAEILNKPGRLNPIEYALIQQHAQAGYDILKDIRFPWPIARIVREHHERIDGSGYPDGKSGEALLLESKILTVADVVEAMTTHRPYRPGLGLDAALAEIERHRGVWYDPEVSDACVQLLRSGHFSFDSEDQARAGVQTAGVMSA